MLEVEADLRRFAGTAAEQVVALLAEPLADGLTRRDGLRFAALLHDIGKPGDPAERGWLGHRSSATTPSAPR